jgi:hypothetical protein
MHALHTHPALPGVGCAVYLVGQQALPGSLITVVMC